jgi:hypothetical protein
MLTSLIGVAALAAVGASSLVTITPTKASTSDKTMLFNSAHNVPTGTGTYQASDISVGQFDGASTVQTEISQSKSTDTLSFGGSHFATLTFNSTNDWTGSDITIKIYAKNIKAVSFTVGDTYTTATPTAMLMVILNTANGYPQQVYYSESLSRNELREDLSQDYSVYSTDTNVYTNLEFEFMAKNSSVNETIFIKSISITWNC